MECYTKQYCVVCGKTVEIDALYFLMNLDDIDKTCTCDDCKKLKGKEEKE